MFDWEPGMLCVGKTGGMPLSKSKVAVAADGAKLATRVRLASTLKV